MKNILIIYPHWPPSNLAGVHRARLISNFLHDFNWHPIILSVKPEYYEETPDPDIIKTVNPKTELIYTDARKVGKPRIIGDIGLRAFKYLKNEALRIISEREIDFVWIPIPSFYTAVLGRILHNKTQVAYGIDYIDPWVRNISNRKTIRSVLSNLAARILEPYAVKKASLISGVSQAYYQPVLARNFKNRNITHTSMPYGFDPNDHKTEIKNLEYPWDEYPNCIPIVYAGAFLPLSGYFTELLFRAIKELQEEEKINPDVKLFFVGTGSYTHKSITQYAREAGISDTVIEIRRRFPFLHIQNFLSKARGVLIIGSTEKHYTASKTFQAILSGRPVFSVFHAESSALKIMHECRTDQYSAAYDESQNQADLFNSIKSKFLAFAKQKEKWQPDYSALDKYSAKESTRKLVDAVEKTLNRQNTK
jgi:glycosyltransferase involved in cell wall biosynthesis